MAFVDLAYTGLVNFVQKRIVPIAERRLRHYEEPPAEYIEKLAVLGLHPEKMYLGGMVHEPVRSALIMADIERCPPREAIECGAGNSTTWLLALAAKHGFRLTSLENHPDTIAYINYLLEGTPYLDKFQTETCGFTRYRKPDGSDYWWYDVDFTNLSRKFDLVFIDGPMSTLVGRGGALYRLWEHILPGARIYVDDANRPHERRMIEEWRRDFPDLRIEYSLPTLALLTKLGS